MNKQYYIKQMLGFNKESEQFIKLDKDWILSFDDMNELGKAVKQKMIDKIIELDKDNKRLEKALNE
jgi:hypothetical protein